MALRRTAGPFDGQLRVPVSQFMRKCQMMLRGETVRGELAALATRFACVDDDRYVDVPRFMYALVSKARVAKKYQSAIKRSGAPLPIFKRINGTCKINWQEFRRALHTLGLALRQWEARSLFDNFCSTDGKVDAERFCEEMLIITSRYTSAPSSKHLRKSGSRVNAPNDDCSRPPWRGTKNFASTSDRMGRFTEQSAEDAGVFQWFSSLDSQMLPYLETHDAERWVFSK